MPRLRRIAPPGYCLHIVNRGNDRRTIFPQRTQYESFLRLMGEAKARYPVAILGYCLMPNHFHLVVRPEDQEALSAYMHWLTGVFACTLRQDTRSTGDGHVFQRRFWCAVVEQDWHLLTVMRYVEANALRAHMVDQAQQWRWGSLWERTVGRRNLLDPLPLCLPREWKAIVNTSQSGEELEALRAGPKLGRPKIS